MYKPQSYLTNELSPQRKLAIKSKKPTIKINFSLNKSSQHKHNLSELSTPKYSNPNKFVKVPATTTAKKVKEIPKLLFTKIRYDGDVNLSTTRARKHKHTLSENINLLDYSSASNTKVTGIKQLNSNNKQTENISSTDSLVKVSTPRRIIEEERKLLWHSTKLPATPATVLKIFMHKMNNFEQAEILSYHEIYFIGNYFTNSGKDVITRNNGYDDDRGDYKITIGDHIAYRFEILNILGRGSFGQVVRVFDHKNKLEVALKIIRNKSRFHEQALVEIEILKYLKDKDANDNYCIVHLEDYFIFRKHMCITFELLSINLYEFLKSNSFQGLSSSLIRRFASQILHALLLLNRYKIIHCDLKPENILLKQPNRSALKVIDFGSSCFYEKRMYTYIQSRFYRAPEIILGISYSTSIDIWSFGCILVELYTGYPLFPGESESEQIQCMMEVLGLPPISVMDRSTRKKLFFDQDGTPKITANSRGKIRLPGRKSLRDLLKGSDIAFLDLVCGCLEWDPIKRITPEEALAHDWMIDNAKKLNKSNSRGGSAQPHQGLTSRHNKKTSEITVKPTLHRSHKKSLNLFN
ncbi:hypothetical protein SteCoe_26787 [Stentor coeruleus]|uniref:dual-specificity kinase n=1 Tax=Stentor coeruleus TaxID=5963 RepID=A0A1R2BCD1_9CILI|nr:hypothetical protein SteCoe_26787 [Stentor coeruleus]